MDTIYYKELLKKLNDCLLDYRFKHQNIYVFGHCEATLTLIDEMEKKDIVPKAILDNSNMKHGIVYKGIPVIAPEYIRKENPKDTVVLIVNRYYEEMKAQLQRIGFIGRIVKLVDFNTYAEYSLSRETISRKQTRIENGIKIISTIKQEYPGYFRVFCPFMALGDIYLMASYLPYFLKKRSVDRCVIIVSKGSISEVISLFGDYSIKVLEQEILDSAIQATIYMQEKDAFIAHQDRPYVVNLHKALYIKKISLETIYRCGVFGLEKNCKPVLPCNWKEYRNLSNIRKGRAVIISPYAKSVPALPNKLWDCVVKYYSQQGYQLFTNVYGEEKSLPGTLAISPQIGEMKSVVEQAGVFIGIRNGLCDVIRTAKCEKIALYPDYYYCDTQWKAIDMYRIENFKNIVMREDLQWEMN